MSHSVSLKTVLEFPDFYFFFFELEKQLAKILQFQLNGTSRIYGIVFDTFFKQCFLFLGFCIRFWVFWDSCCFLFCYFLSSFFSSPSSLFYFSSYYCSHVNNFYTYVVYTFRKCALPHLSQNLIGTIVFLLT